ncbi:helix-turn-helix domain-containing protein [Paracoccus sp. S3-43]|uniref:helix-turn-helix domain-containing protein n=1 Tax=Paracoccus sp. S3-43 TaxID=3030011 RepID=UPI0023AF77D6|nr:helix-turn-helix domain-containing protein [Paracoccus sp. S3-43]WEF24623.1 helix-turn-helix domain-containing protein [Paracoccus sp. S3-43]
MSNDATHWAVKQRGLKPATKIVLWHLADRHNPDFGCFPSQERLAHDCEMSRSTVNEHLNILESMGLIRRERRVNAQTRRQESTRYLLAFEEGFVADSPCPESGHGAVSGKGAEPCPENAESRVRNPDTNSVREPLREPSRAQPRGTAQLVSDEGDEDFQRFWQAHPRPSSRDRTWQAWQAAKKGGAEVERIIEAASRYAVVCAGTESQYRVRSDAWLSDQRWKDFDDALRRHPGPVRPNTILWAKTINARGYVPPSAFNPGEAREMLSAGLVTSSDLRRIGVNV